MAGLRLADQMESQDSESGQIGMIFPFSIDFVQCREVDKMARDEGCVQINSKLEKCC